jgi:16S rRNA (guanine527-N7)-methyltransferase
VSATPPPDFIPSLSALGVELSAATLDKLGAYLDKLLVANLSFNLTTVTELNEAWMRHLFDSLTLVPALADLAPGSRVVDVGSGGGLPGIPLAIALPELSFTLLEATGKKAHFLESTKTALGLDNVRVVTDRAESFGQGAGREAFDAVTARAVSRMSVLLELSLPLLRVGGDLVAIKGEQADTELAEASRALQILSGQVLGASRTRTGTVVRVRKLAATRAKYPRRPGEPKKNPL